MFKLVRKVLSCFCGGFVELCTTIGAMILVANFIAPKLSGLESIVVYLAAIFIGFGVGRFSSTIINLADETKEENNNNVEIK